MLESLKPVEGKRWPRGQRFRLSIRGLEAYDTYRQAIQASHAVPGRESLEHRQRAWASPLGIEPNDGIVLAELRTGRRGIGELVRALEPCGVSTAEVKASIDRLVAAQIAEPIPLASQIGS